VGGCGEQVTIVVTAGIKCLLRGATIFVGPDLHRVGSRKLCNGVASLRPVRVGVEGLRVDLLDEMYLLSLVEGLWVDLVDEMYLLSLAKGL